MLEPIRQGPFRGSVGLKVSETWLPGMLNVNISGHLGAWEQNWLLPKPVMSVPKEVFLQTLKTLPRDNDGS